MLSGLAAPDARYLVTVSADSQEAALQAAEKAGQRLDALVEQGVIGGYDSPARFLPTPQLQQPRLASLPPAEVLRERLQRALVDAPLSAARLEPFIADTEAARAAGPMTRADLDGSALALAVDSLLIHGKDDIVVKYSQSVEMAEALREAGKPVEFVTLAGEDHWLSRGATRLQMLQATIAFIEKHNPPWSPKE